MGSIVYHPGGNLGDYALALVGTGAYAQVFKNQVVKNVKQQIAVQFYKRAGFPPNKIVDHIKGINFDKGVETTILKKGTVVQQWVGKNGVGNYFTTGGNGASKNLGIKYSDRVLKKFKLTDDVEVLKSQAADFKGNAGGGTQLFSPNLKTNIKPVD